MVVSGNLENFSIITVRDESPNGPVKDELAPQKKKSKKEVIEFLFSLVQSKSPVGIQDDLRLKSKEIVEK